jgi:hypothetical protein
MVLFEIILIIIFLIDFSFVFKYRWIGWDFGEFRADNEGTEVF